MVDPEDHKATKNKIHKAIVALGYPITILPPLLSLELPDLDTGCLPSSDRTLPLCTAGMGSISLWSMAPVWLQSWQFTGLGDVDGLGCGLACVSAVESGRGRGHCENFSQ
jgi:hypothetical protein